MFWKYIIQWNISGKNKRYLFYDNPKLSETETETKILPDTETKTFQLNTSTQ